MSDLESQQNPRRQIEHRRYVRRICDLIGNDSTEEEKQTYQLLLWSEFWTADKHIKERRSGKDRRAYQ